jgi:hypothetical protein
MSAQLDWLNAAEDPTTNLAPAAVTAWTPAQVGQALVDAWARLFGASATASSIAILLSQWALETGWGKSCWCSNLGNARPPSTRGDVLCCQIPGGKVSEILDGHECFFAPPSRGSTFRAFRSLSEGADYYLNLLHTRFSHAWPAVIAGDPGSYSLALHESRYYTADVATYTRTMQSLFQHFRSVALTGSTPLPAPEVPPEIMSAVRAAHFTDWLNTLDVDPSEFGASNIPKELDT